MRRFHNTKWCVLGFAGLWFTFTGNSTAFANIDPFTLASVSKDNKTQNLNSAVVIPCDPKPRTEPKPKRIYVNIFNAFPVFGNEPHIAHFRISLSDPSPGNISVTYSTMNGEFGVAGKQYVAKSGQLAFKKGAEVLSADIQTLEQKRGAPLAQRFYVKLSSAANVIIGDDRGQGTILNVSWFR